MSTRSSSEFEGISLYERLPFNWVSADLGDLNDLDHANHETARALQALAVYEEMPREMGSDASHHANPEILHLQVKVDVLLSLVGRLMSSQAGVPARHSVVLRGQSVEWSGPDQASAQPGDSGYARDLSESDAAPAAAPAEPDRGQRGTLRRIAGCRPASSI